MGVSLSREVESLGSLCPLGLDLRPGVKPEVVRGIQEQLTRGSCIDLWGHSSSFNRARTRLMVGLCLEVTLQRGEGGAQLACCS